ncbi:MAG: enoyl-CoA hydratase/isomerase family protein [Coxiellaceae bacterium]|nr:enoyl-CoA hydratase/isomerase family protein [Coxiellaceae bacterium]
MTNKTILITKPEEHLLQITLNRPEVRNAINVDMMQELLLFWESMMTDTETRCIILTGTPPAFCAGADLKVRKDLDIKTWMKQHEMTQQAMRAMVKCPIPVIAAVNGHAFGGGLELTLAADFAYASDNAKFAQSETKLGIMPGAMGTQNLPRAVGARRAKELTFTAEPFTAQQAFEWGIINKICSGAELLNSSLETAKKIAGNAPIANRQAKKSINVAGDLDIQQGYTFEIDTYNELLNTEDRVEGINAFNEKRKPDFKGK